jgi:hypothetical protein
MARAPSGHHHTHERSSVCLHDEHSRCSEIGLNTFETLDTVRYPHGDIMNAVGVERGAITKSWNLGLRNPQAKKLTVDMYNSGCLDLHGCVPGVPGTLAPDVPGFGCGGRVGSMGPAMSKAYDFLNAPFLEDGFEFKPPDYMQGIRDAGPNSVLGWARAPSGIRVWEKNAEAQRVISFKAAGLPVPSAPGCG